MLILAGWAMAIVYGSLVPLDYEPISWQEAVNKFREIRDLDLGVAKRADWVANLLIYIPLGLIGAVLACRLSHAFVWRLPALVAVACSATALAFAVEFTQLWFPDRTVSQNDLRAEAIGSCVGVILGLAVSTLGATRQRRLGILSQSLRSLWGLLYLLAIIIYSLLPGDFILSGEEWREMLNRGGVNLVPLADCKLSAREVFKRLAQIGMFAPLGFLIASRACKRSIDGAALPAVAAMLGGAFTVVIEVAQLSVFTRQTSVTAVLFGAAGAGLGGLAFVWTHSPDNRPSWLAAMVAVSKRLVFWRIAAAAYAAAVLLIMLAPFQLVEGAAERAERWGYLMQAPFAAMYVGTEFAALTNILQKGFIFCGFGALLQVVLRPQPTGSLPRSFGYLAACGLLSTLLGTSVEIAQVYFNAHLPDVTDILIYTSSALIGFRVCESLRPVAGRAGEDEGDSRLYAVGE